MYTHNNASISCYRYANFCMKLEIKLLMTNQHILLNLQAINESWESFSVLLIIDTKPYIGQSVYK